MRAGMLASKLAGLGMDVRWFTSTFDHYQKRQRPSDNKLAVSDNYSITVLSAPGYAKNVGLARLRHNRAFANRFERFARAESEWPDILVTDVPTTETAESVVKFGKAADIPTVLSIRDLWPDFFEDFAPKWLRPLARTALLPLTRQARFACANATSIVGISNGYLEWGLDKGGRARRTNDRVIPLGYAPGPLISAGENASILRQIGVRDGANVVAFIGSWGHTYDLQLVLEAASLLSSDKDIQFVIAGKGEQWEALHHQFAQLPNVLLPGWINTVQIASVLRRADVGLLPYVASAPQGLPNKVFEYLAYGAYQIATLQGEAEQFYQQTGAGRVVGDRSPRHFAVAIVDALNDPEVARKRSERIERFVRDYDADVVYGQLADHVISVANARRT